MDPPYKEKKLPFLLDAITKLEILNTGGVIIIHRHKKEEENFPKEFNLILEKNYGVSKIIFGDILT
jgi:16S rRNA (guanine966-N2)-methyltransferase